MKILALCAILIHYNLYSQNLWSLQDCVDTALFYNSDVNLSKINADIAQIRVNDFKYNYIPDLNGGASHGYNWGQTIDPFTNQFATDRVQFNNFFLNSSLNLFSGFSQKNTGRLLSLESEISNLNGEIAKSEVTMKVLAAFLQVELNKEILNIAKNSVETSKIEVEAIKLKTKEGFEIESELLNLKAVLAREEHLTNQMKDNLLKSEMLLQRLIGIDYDTSFHTKMDTLLKISSLNRTEAESRSMELTFISKETEIQVSKGSFYPTLTIQGSIGSGYSENNQFIESNGSLSPKPFRDQLNENFYQSASLTLSVPIFNKNTARSVVKIKTLELDQVRLENENRQREITNYIIELKLDALRKESLLQSSLVMRNAEKLSFANNQKQFREGLIDATSFAKSKSDLFRAESQFYQAKFGLIFAKLLLAVYN